MQGNLVANEEQNRRTTARNIRFPNKWLNKLTSLLSKKGSGISPAWVIEACRRRLTSEKESIYIN